MNEEMKQRRMGIERCRIYRRDWSGLVGGKSQWKDAMIHTPRGTLAMRTDRTAGDEEAGLLRVYSECRQLDMQ